MAAPRLKVLLAGSSFDGTDVGESFSAFRMVEALSRQCDLTVLCLQRHGRKPMAQQLPQARVVTWAEPKILRTRFERINAMLKPALPFAFRSMGRWAAKAQADGAGFDIAHQAAPQAMRYASPFRSRPMPYVIGPLGGGLETPQGFAGDVTEGGLQRRLRGLDGWRLAHDRALRQGYMRADLVLGVAPYIGDRLKAAMPIKRFEVMLERAHDGVMPVQTRTAEPGQLRLAHVGRVIRTKGLRDVIRAMGRLRDMPGITLTAAGDGPDLAACKAEATALGLDDRIRFLGRIPRDEVDAVMGRADVFAFPSFREPMGGVLFEALAWGLPIVTAARGGPDYIVDDSCGIRLPAQNPDQLATDLAATLRDLAEDPDRRKRLEHGARARLLSFGSWDDKAAQLISLYHDVLARA